MEKHKRWTAVIKTALAFLIPVGIYVVILGIWGQYPFGDKTLMLWDMDWQYNAFFGYLHDILHGNADAAYSFSIAIGGNTAGIITYYLMSPFNLIFYFFGQDKIYIGVMVLLLLKTGFIGLSMNLYLNRREKGYGTLLFSTAYALSAYMIAYFYNIMWLEAIMLLPLVAWGIEKLIEEKKFLLYILALWAGIWTCYYMGYMLCVFSVLYFLIYLFCFYQGKKEYVKKLVGFAASSLLAGAMTAFTTLPALKLLSEGKAQFDPGRLSNFSVLTGIRSTILHCFAGTINFGQMLDSAPLLYSGLLILLLAAYLLFCSKVRIREKVGYVLFLLILLLSFRFYNLDCIWHGMNMPQGSDFRFAFIFCFWIVTMASRAYFCWQQEEKRKKWILPLVGVVWILLLLFSRNEPGKIASPSVLAINIIFIVLYLVLFHFKFEKVQVKGIVCLLLCVELIYNAQALYLNSPSYEVTRTGTYEDFHKVMADFRHTMSEDESLFRSAMEGNAYRTMNDDLMYGFRGLNSYSSLESRKTHSIAGALGYESNIISGIHYRGGSSMAADNLLGVKYIGTSGLGERDAMVQRKISGDAILYENKNALRLANLAGKELLLVDGKQDDIFQMQNEIYAAMDEDAGGDIFNRIYMEELNAVGCWKDEAGIFYCFQGAAESYVEYSFRVHNNKRNRIYLYDLESGVENVAINSNGQWRMTGEGMSTKYLGSQQDVTVKLRFYIWNNGTGFDPAKTFLYEEDKEVLKRYCQQILKQDVSVECETDSLIRIQCTNETAESRYLFCTIPEDMGWTVMVDGIEVKPETALNACMAIPVQPGEHTVTLRYRTPGLLPGTVITLCCAAILAAAEIIRRKKWSDGKLATIRKDNYNREE